MRPLILILMFLPLTACSLFESKELRTLRRSPDYRAGYQDGCNSAWGPGADKRRDDTIVRDDTQYQKNRAYRMGWNRGLNTCRSTGYTGGALPGTGNSGPFPDMNPGNGGRPRGL
ncbi:MAG TPA: hypothetical protein VJL82_06905 [Rhizomicrobium sp.]|nr:hypothetical protein [Rhizomicrobium sp.]